MTQATHDDETRDDRRVAAVRRLQGAVDVLLAVGTLWAIEATAAFCERAVGLHERVLERGRAA
jgi:hypothetical protein